MEDLFEFLFGVSGRINRAKYWRSVVLFGVAGLLAAVILFTPPASPRAALHHHGRPRLCPLTALGVLHHHRAVA
jgi:hypothetical protein